ncbi:putative transcription factor WD40-like family [Helianthus anomalus]
MASTGKYSLVYILLFFHFSYIQASTDPQDSPDLTQILTLLNTHIHQLTKLDDLVKNLTELVTRLEQQQQQQPRITRDQNSVSLNDAPVIPDLKEGDQNDAVREVGLVTDTTETRVERLGAVSVTKHSLFWSERFQFVSAVKLDTKPTSLNVLPFKDGERLSKYIAVGDDVGNLYVFTRYGEVMVRFDTGTGCSITSMVSYLSVVRNESIVVSGHENGVILVHKVWEVPNGDELYSVQRETVRKLEQTSGLAISILEVHHVGRTRYIVSTDVSGTIKVFKEGGSVIGTIVPDNRPRVFLKQKLLFLTETGAGSLDLRSMKLREAPCEGLNGSYALNYVFDASDRGKAYGFTSAGELVHLLIYGDSMNFKCRVRSKKKFDVDHGPLAFEAIKGYFLIVSQEKVFVYNVSSQLYVRAGLPRLVFSAGLDEIVASFLNYRAMGRLDSRKSEARPLIASDHEKLVILSLGNGYIGMYHSNLPVTKGEFNTMLWSTPVLFFILFLFVAWHFFANKKEALTSWGPDDPFTNGPPTVPNERSFGDPTSRTHDIMDMRSGGGAAGGGSNGGDGGIRGLPRRYGSPTRYTGASSNSFRPTAIDPNPRPGTVDPDFIGSELKYRGPSMESSGFGKRREGLFVNSQVVDDHGS